MRLIDVSAAPEGGMASASAAGIPVVVCRYLGQVHVFEDRCPHRNGPLSGGNFVEGRLICPWHAWEFLCETGAHDYNPAVTLRRYPARLEDGAVWIDA